MKMGVATLVCGDALETLKQLASGSCRMCCTSPPYWGLRDYGVDGQLGLEATPEEYVAKMVAVFREVRRILTHDGTLWLVLGDSYAGGGRGGNPEDSIHAKQRTNAGSLSVGPSANVAGRKPKDLVGIPWMVAFALREDGWYLRSDIIWAKPNPMPESVQGSHYSRHRVTIEEYERLSGLPYIDERAGDAWAGDMPGLSEREVSSSQAPLSAGSQGDCDGSRERSAGGCSGTAAAGEPLTIWSPQQGEIRSYGKGQTDANEGPQEIPRESAGKACQREAPSTDERQSSAQETTAKGRQPLSQEPEGQGALTAATCATPGRDSLHVGTAHGSRLARDCAGAPGPVLLLQEEEETDDGPCDPTQEGRAAHKGERRAGVRSVQLQETGPADSLLLVGCPGCPKCLKHHGYTFHLSAGRPTKSHEYLFLLSKSKRYYYDAGAIRTEAKAEYTKMPDGWDTGPGGHGSFHRNGREKGRTIDKQRGHSRRHAGFNDRWDGMTVQEQRANGANARSVWTIPTQSFSGAHFATFPEELARRCIVAGSAPGDTVLDPFAGSGTVGQVATGNARSALLIELNPAYVELARQRIGPLLVAS